MEYLECIQAFGRSGRLWPTVADSRTGRQRLASVPASAATGCARESVATQSCVVNDQTGRLPFLCDRLPL